MEASKDDFMNAFERSQDKGDLKLTQEEADKFKTAFEDPEFCKLMSDYVADLQNPEYRAETEAYIGQLENEDKVPQGKELIRPEKGFVAKSRKRDHKDKEGEDSKVFINIVHSEKITKPTKTDTDKGQNWSLPYSLGPPHMEKDKKEDAAVAFDCCYNPEALSLAHRYKAFRDLLVTTAIQGIEEACRLQNQTTTVSKDFHILKGISYKTGEVPTMMIDITSKENKWNADTTAAKEKGNVKGNEEGDVKKKVSEAKQVEEEKSAIDMVAALEEESVENADKPSGIPAKKSSKTNLKPAVKKGFLNNAKTAGSIYPNGSDEGKRGVVPTKPLVEELPEGYVSKNPAKLSTNTPELVGKDPSAPLLTAREVKRKPKPTSLGSSMASTQSSGIVSSTEGEFKDEKVPKYTLIERGVMGLGDFDGGNSSHKRRPASTRPEELVYRIEIPLVAKTSKVELDVGQREVKLKYLDVYDMTIRLPYAVNDKKGGAKFDKGKKLLTITLPVIEEVKDSVEVGQIGDVEVVSERNEDEEDVSVIESDIKEKKKVSGSDRDHERWLSSGGAGDSAVDNTDTDADAPVVEELGEEECVTESLAEEVARKAKEAVQLAQKKQKDFPAAQSTPDTCTDLKNKAALSVSVTSGVCDEEAKTMAFLPSGSYVGSKKGYAFKTGENGLGYYKDSGGLPKKSAPKADVLDSLDSLDISNVTTEYAKRIKKNEGNAMEDIDWTEFDYQCRQTKEGVAMIVDVKNIIDESVSISFNASSFDVSFAAASATGGSGNVGGEVKTIDYGLSFDCLQEIDAKKCTFDVASDNMVIVLQKKVAVFWISDAIAGGGKGAIVQPKVYAGDVSSTSSSTGTRTNTSTINCGKDSSSSASSSEDTAADSVDDAVSLLKKMHFGAAGVMDLD